MTIKQVSKYKMQCIAYYIMDLFENWNLDNITATPKIVLENIGYDEYHNFAKVRIPFWWYQDIMQALDLDTSEVLVEVARVKGSHTEDLHYHKMSHAICVILGDETGFKNGGVGLIQLGNQTYNAIEGKECYFPVGIPHTFHGGSSSDLYFISVQSPPLLTKENDDFYFIKPSN